ncbi:MAG: type II toxin-antitoxin system prevent-host-death family antitoxin [Mycobacteriales bacterium]
MAQPVSSEDSAELAVTEIRDNFAEVVNNAAYGGSVTYVMRRGRRLAAVVPAEAAEYLEQVEDRYWGEQTKEAVARIRAGGSTVSWESLQRSDQ